ncbi:uncharacterized protein LOC107047185 isoform X2 [Diachasma alloeum]|uniref:uncharacterized protein LOC107047185 isoform X2 n=1 Tax=Diachasma alloeum TaxID=454923 RepID=UPI00073819A4|nr:uncharacterized protein LOC107047185 isoform X2 [Diachasma alloeum]
MTSSHQYSASQSQILMPSQSPHVLKERFFQRSASSLDAHHKYTSCGKKRHVKSKSSKYHPDKCPPQKSQIHPATMTTASNCGNQDSYRYVRNGQDERPCKNWPSQSANMIGVQGQGDSRSCNSQNQGNPLSSRTAPPWQEHSRSTSPFLSFSHPMDAYPTSYPWSQSSISSEPYPFQSMGYYGHHYPPPQQADPDNMNYCNCRPLPSEFPMIETGDNTQDKVFTDLQKVRNPLYRIDEFVQNRNSKTTSPFKTQQSSAIEQRSLGVETHSLNQETDVIVESPKHMGFLGSIIDKNSENCQDQAKGENKNEERHETRDLPNISTSATSVQSQSIEKAESSSSQDDSDMPDDYSDGEGVHSSDEKSLESNLCMETSDNKNIDKAAQRLAKLLPNPIPRGWVMCQKILLKALTYNCEKTNSARGNEMFTPPPLPEEFYKSGEDKVEIAERCGFYLKKNLVTYVEMMTKDGNGFYWRSAVTIVLNEVYKGSYSLTDYCALGARGGGRPGICKRLFAGLMDLQVSWRRRSH